MASTIDVVEFEIGKELYAMDIQLAREIVEMVPITPLPKAPEYIAGIINLRGEITTVLFINNLIGIQGKPINENQKIIILVPEASGGSNVGIIVDDVHSVIQVNENDIEHIEGGISSGAGYFVKGIIKIHLDPAEKKKKDEEGNYQKSLIIWIDIEKILRELVDLERK
jgi:purine-binding chemotaxis protein CheW